MDEIWDLIESVSEGFLTYSCHSGLLHKLQAAGVTGAVLARFRNYHCDRNQRVILPGAVSDWKLVRTGVPQDFILRPLLFLLYINDIVNDIGSNIQLFADDTSLFIIVEDPLTAAGSFNTDLDRISQWVAALLVSFNPAKIESLLISRNFNRPYHPPLFYARISDSESRIPQTSWFISF